MVLELSLQYSQPPSAWAGRDGTWTPRDRMLTLAYSMYKATLCADCGRPQDECSNNSYTVQSRICNASAAVERYRKEHKDPAPGLVLSAQKVDQDGPNPTIASAPEWWREKNGFNPDGSRKKG